MEQYDLIIIGAGPAGLSAGMYAGYAGLKALVLEENISGGLAAEIPVLENYPGILEGISGRDLIDSMVGQCEKAKTQIHQFEKVVRLKIKGKEK
ncbi:MAG: FAD-binding protein, partial [Candidatus Theseobacter exili]|nr:FAD-binding protein [Candidatus Theseobacter exili]